MEGSGIDVISNDQLYKTLSMCAKSKRYIFSVYCETIENTGHHDNSEYIHNLAYSKSVESRAFWLLTDYIGERENQEN